MNAHQPQPQENRHNLAYSILAGAQLSFSSEGEDVLIRKALERHFFEHAPEGYRGVYVDVGAYDPWVNSNTAALWLAGWSGVNVDPNARSWSKFEEVRPGDDNHCVGVGAHEHSAWYVTYDRPELNRFVDKPVSAFGHALRGSKVSDQQLRGITTLGRIMEIHPRCDFLNIDVEGFELDVLKGFTNMGLDERRPMIICVEIIERGYGGWLKHPVMQWMKEHDFVPLSRLHCSAIFVDKRRAVFR